MTKKIGVEVSATFDSSKVNQAIDGVGQKIDQINKKPLKPIDQSAVKVIDELMRKFDQLLKVDGELRRRAKATGNFGRHFNEYDFSTMYPDANARVRKVNQIYDYLGLQRPTPAGGGGGAPPLQPPRPHVHPPSPQPSGGPSLGGTAAQVAGAGLRAIGPAGGVAAGALNTGMASGAGAGLMGLLGGLAALGVSKMVSGVMEKVGEAEGNNIGLDRLKRVLGDVNVSFDALKKVVNSSADNLKITYGEMGQYAAQYARAGNLGTADYKNLGDEVGVGFGLSRSYGLDPSSGIGVLGQMRGMGVIKDTQEARKFALLIGETIGKSGAFAKADEVMDAIGNYASIQTRNSMGGANAAGYGGMFSAMVGSGIAGMDPSGAASLLGRINASLQAGGAKGEASQFFTGMVGNSLGLNPLQTQVLREGGAFATNSGMFGAGSAYARYMGHTGPQGDKTFLQATIDKLNQQYGGNSEDQKLLRAQAFSNHTGVNMNQAMAILSLKPNEMGDMQKYAGDITKLNASGIGSLSKVLYGSAADRQYVAQDMLSRTDVSAQEKARLENVMKSGSEEEQKQILAQLVASREQERTMGSDIRDSKAALDNIKTSIADKLVPLTLEMRHGIMYMAGGGKKSSDEVMKDVVELDSKYRRGKIEERYKEIDQNSDRINTLRARHQALSAPGMMGMGLSPEEVKRRAAEQKQIEEEIATLEQRQKELIKAKNDALEEEDARRRRELKQVDDSASIRSGMNLPSGSGGGASAMGAAKRDEAMKFFMDKGWTREQAAGIVANIAAESGGNEGITGDNGAAYGLAQWHPDRQRAFEQKYGKSIKGSSFRDQLDFINYELTEGGEKSAGNLLKRATGAGQAAEYVTRYYERPADKDGQSRVRAAAAEKIMSEGTRMPDGYAGAGAGRGADPRSVVVTSEPIVVRIEDGKGNRRAPDQFITLKVAQPGESLVKK